MWHAKNTGLYAYDSLEGEENGTEIASYLLSLPPDSTTGEVFSLEACAAICGNCYGEGGLNPWRWQSDYVPDYAEFLAWTPSQANDHGYGLYGFTPANKYINSQHAAAYAADGYAPNFYDIPGNASDGLPQTMYMVELLPTWASRAGVLQLYAQELRDSAWQEWEIELVASCTLDQFKTGGIYPSDPFWNMYYLTAAFMMHWERPSATYIITSLNHRNDAAQYFLQYFTDNPPGPLKRKKKMPLWMMLNYLK